MNIAFFGTPDFAVPSLKKIFNSKHLIKASITGVPKPVGRGQILRKTPVSIEAEKLNIPVIEIDNLSNLKFIHSLEKLKVDIFIIVAFRILPEKIFSIPKYGAVNLHASLLPKYRGSAPIHHAILNGETETGVTTFQINERVDAGRIYLQKKYIITNKATTGMVWDDLSIAGADLLVDTLDGIENNSLTPISQDLQKSTSAPKLKREMYRINWEMDSVHIHNQIRAFSPIPGAFSTFLGRRLKLYNSDISDTKNLKPGQFKIIENNLIIGTGAYDIIVKSVQLEGKNKMPVSDFYKGIINKIEGKEIIFGK